MILYVICCFASSKFTVMKNLRIQLGIYLNKNLGSINMLCHRV